MSNTADVVKVGVQEEGTSPYCIKRMALDALDFAVGDKKVPFAVDLGGGRGELAVLLAPRCERVILIDYAPPAVRPSPLIETIQTDLNANWPVEANSVDFLFSLECIEHLENPRHFLRETARVLKSGAFGFVSTPNQHSLLSKVAFICLGQHRCFLGKNYPHHITALLQDDLLHLLHENHLKFIRWFFSNEDNLPGLGWKIPLGGKAFSKTIGVLFQKL